MERLTRCVYLHVAAVKLEEDDLNHLFCKQPAAEFDVKCEDFGCVQMSMAIC